MLRSPAGSGARRAPSRSPPPSAPASRSAPSPSTCRCSSAAASNAASRCGADTATATDGSESVRSPTRCSSATRSSVGPAPARFGDDLGHDPARGLFVGLVGHRAHSLASLGVVAHDSDEANDGTRAAASTPRQCNASTGSAASVSATQSHTSVGGLSTASSLRNEPRRSPGRPDPPTAAAVANTKGVVTLDRDGKRGRDRLRGRRARRRELRHSPRRRRSRVPQRPGSRTRSTGSGCTRASCPPTARPSAPRPRPLWTTHADGRGRRRDPDPRRPRRGRRARRPSGHPSEPNVTTSTPIATARAVAFAVADSVVAVSVRRQVGHATGLGRLHPANGRGPHQRPAHRRLDEDRRHHARRHRAHRTRRRSRLDDRPRPARRRGRRQRSPAPIRRAAPERQFTRSRHRSQHERPEPGDTVWVVGAPSPGDSSPWMSSGLVASTDSLVAVASGPTTSGLLETAAASSSGSTGGALVDHAGDVTGIVLSPVGDDRMTYAVPISTAHVDRERPSGARVRDARRARHQRHRRHRRTDGLEPARPRAGRGRRRSRRRRDRVRRPPRGRTRWTT